MMGRLLSAAAWPFRLEVSPFWNRSWKHRLARFGLWSAGCYGGALIVLMFLESAFLYHPTGPGDWFDPPRGLHVEDAELSATDGTRIHGWWSPPEGWTPSQGAILYCHGNAGNLSHRGDLVPLWQHELGQAVLMIDYPGYGKSGGKPTEAGCYASADAGYDWLVEAKNVPPERILLWGGSLGGAVMVDLASRRPHRALVLISTFTSLPDMAQNIFFWAPARYLVRSKYDSLGKIGQCSRPVFVAHYSGDDLVPFSQGQRLFLAANEPKEFFPMSGHRHDEGPMPDFYPALRSFLAAQAPIE
jgi:uncharacterized protein